MELSVLVQRVEGNGFRAWCAEPLSASAEGATREEALSRLRGTLEEQLRDGVEVVRLSVGGGLRIQATPIWPDDQFTRDLLGEIAAARQAADQKPDPWDTPDGTDPS